MRPAGRLYMHRKGGSGGGIHRERGGEFH